MEHSGVNPRGARFTDEQLRADLQAGMRPADIARKYGVTRQAVGLRVKQLDLTTASAAVAPVESERHVAQQIDAMEQLTLNVRRANLLMDACDEWLRDVTDPEKYDIGPRAGEIDVGYQVEVRTESGYRTVKRKKKLDLLLSDLEGVDDDGARFVRVEKGEYRHADPRELILRTQQETRQTVGLVADLIQKLIDVRTMEAWREAVLEEVAKESPDCARRIAERVRRSIVLYSAFSGPGAVRPEDPN